VIAVIGATGTVGREIVAQLREQRIGVLAVTRNPAAAGLPAGVEVRPGDLTDPESLESAIGDGVPAAFLVWPFTDPGQAARLAPEVVAVLARRTPRIVYLSAQAAAADPDSFWARVERAIEDSGVQWTFLRPTGFATNTRMWAEQIRSGVVRWPYGAAVRSLIHERDIAAVAVAALTQDGHRGLRYLLTGPEAISQADQVRIIGEEAGHPVRWQELPPAQATDQLAAAWGDRAFAEHAMASWARMAAEPEPVTSVVAEVTGVPARTFREWARDHRDEFRLPTTAEVAQRYAHAFRTGDLDAALALLSPGVVRAAPIEAADGPGELHGVQAIMDNSAALNAGLRFHSVEVGDPFVRGDQFAVRFAFDQTYLPTGRHQTAVKMSLCTVADGAIVREEVYYHTPRHSS